MNPALRNNNSEQDRLNRIEATNELRHLASRMYAAAEINYYFCHRLFKIPDKEKMVKVAKALIALSNNMYQWYNNVVEKNDEIVKNIKEQLNLSCDE